MIAIFGRDAIARIVFVSVNDCKIVSQTLVVSTCLVYEVLQLLIAKIRHVSNPMNRYIRQFIDKGSIKS